MDFDLATLDDIRHTLETITGLPLRVELEYNGFSYVVSMSVAVQKEVNVIEDLYNPQTFLDFVYNEIGESKLVNDLVELRVKERLNQQDEVNE